MFGFWRIPALENINDYSVSRRWRCFGVPQEAGRGGIWESVFFADPSKTEPPTPKKLADAKKKGQVPKSTDLVSSILLIVGVMLLAATGDYGFRLAHNFMGGFLRDYLTVPLTENTVMNVFVVSIMEFARMVGILFMVVMVTGIVGNVVQTGPMFTAEPLKPKLSKLNPISGFKNILLTKRAVFNLAKTVAKCAVASFVTYRFIVNNLETFFAAPALAVTELYPFIKDILVSLCLQIGAVMLLIAIIDLIFQRRTFKEDLKMTKQEVKEESKQQDGNPEIKGKRRQKQMQMAMNRMIAAMNTATVVVTNPTHFAVAIKYVDGEDDIPVIIAKGTDFVAARIREAAKEHEVPIIENKPLARALHAKTEVGDLVPTEFFKAVAEILVQVMKLKKKVV